MPGTKLPKVGTTIFTVMSQLAARHGAVNLGQGFPDFDVPARLVDALDRAMRAGHNQYAPMTGVAALREAIADKTAALYGYRPDPEAEVTVTSGATEAIFNAIHAVVRAGDEVVVLDPAYDCYEPAIDLAGARAAHVPLHPATFAPDWARVRAALGPQTPLPTGHTPHNPAGSVPRAGAEVVVLDPAYDCYEPAIDLAGARAVHVPLDPATFAPDWARVRAAIGPKTRMLIVNTPHNPSGAMLAAGDMAELAAIVQD